MKAFYIISLAILLSVSNSFSQDNITNTDTSEIKSNTPKLTFGIGLGIDYGGFGTQFKVKFFNAIEAYMGIGHNTNNFNISIGTSVSFFKKSFLQPKFSLTYGTTHLIIIEKASQYNESFQGFAFGIGANIFFNKRTGNHFSLGLNILPPSQEFIQATNQLRKDPNVSITEQARDWGITIGYHMSIN